jgi:rod shape-determining protein MreD
LTGIDGQAGEDALRYATDPLFFPSVPALIVLYLFFVGVAAILAQMELPVMFPMLDLVGVGSALVPLVVIYASLELADERGPVLAFALGLLLDLISSTHRLGISVLLLVSLSVLITTQAHKADAKHWIVRLSYVLTGTFCYLVIDYLFTRVESGHWHWPLSVWTKITLASLFNFLLSPLLFFLIGLPPRLAGWKPAREERPRRYAR